MARVVMIKETLDGTYHEEGKLEDDGISRVVLSVDGDRYALYLNEKNKAKLDKALAPFIEDEKPNDPEEFSTTPTGRVRVSTGSRGGGGSGLSPQERAAVRSFAKDRGESVSTRGRLPEVLVDRWRQAGSPL